jgi:hypothetical protein
VTGPYTPDVFVDDPAGGTPITAAKLNRLENAVGGLSARLITAGTGLTGGGDLSADRTLTVAYGTTAGTAAQGNDSGQVPAWNGSTYVPTSVAGSPADATATVKGVVQLAGDLAGTAAAPTVPGKVGTSRLITAGTGLSGGGDLTADRTLTVAYGTAAGTAAQGNDSRITGAAPTASPTFTGTVTTARVVQTPVTVTYAATTTIDGTLGNHFRITLTGNLTLNLPTGLADGQRILVELVQDATGGRTLTLGSGWNVTTSITGAITLTTTASTRSYLGGVYRSSGTKLDVLAFGTGVAA